MTSISCRSCAAPLNQVFCDLGLSPISNSFIKVENKNKEETFYPLKVLVCDQCWLVQLDDCPKSELHFHDDYVYFSSFSESWLNHAKLYVKSMIERFSLNSQSHVIEIASNDGYLLQNFLQYHIPCLGIEPTANTAAVARAKGIETRECFFSCNVAKQLSDEGKKADLLLGNNVLAHVPNINDFVSGMARVLKTEGVITLEFPHLLKLIENNQFDTIYHEHYSYLSLISLLPIFERAGLRIFDVDLLPTHGGSLRVYLCHKTAGHCDSSSLKEILMEEENFGLKKISTYTSFEKRVNDTKNKLLRFMIEAKQQKKRIIAYGAAAKGNTLLNYCGIRTDFIDFVVDKNPTKQGRFLPGSRIPVVAPEAIYELKPDYILILPWNIKEEVMRQMNQVRSWNGKFIVSIPELEVL
jgi:SAM-dependent methyltransferase